MNRFQEINFEFQNRINVMNLVEEVHGETEMSEFECALFFIIKKIKHRRF